MTLEPPAFQLPQLLTGLGFGILDGVLGAKLCIEVGRVGAGVMPMARVKPLAAMAVASVVVVPGTTCTS